MVGMRIVAARLHRYLIPLRRAFTGRASREGLVLELDDDAGRTGLGEAAPLPGFSPETLSEAEGVLRAACAELIGREVAPDPGAIRTALPAPTACPASVRFALETALSDLAARDAARPLAAFLADGARTAVPCNAVIPADATGCPPGYAVVKVKVGVLEPEADRRRLEAILGAAPTEVRLRLDANGAWNLRRAMAVLEGLPAARIDYVEEPLAPAHLDALDDLHRRCGLPFAVDESLADPRRWAELLTRDAVAAVVLKPTLLGGLSPALALAGAARASSKRVVVTTTLESGVGTTACLHLAAAVATSACGLGTLGLLENTLLVEAPRLADGVMHVPSGPGLGVQLDRAGLETVFTCGGRDG
jgi:O-succinylbenzoate synthase